MREYETGRAGGAKRGSGRAAMARRGGGKAGGRDQNKRRVPKAAEGGDQAGEQRRRRGLCVREGKEAAGGSVAGQHLECATQKPLQQRAQQGVRTHAQRHSRTKTFPY